jgi:hypothetical protein
LNEGDVPPGEHSDAFEVLVRRLFSAFACLLAVDDRGHSVTKGTAVFVSIGHLKTLVTVRHVVRSEKLRRSRLLLMFPRLAPDGLAEVGEQTIPLSVPLDLTILWESEDLDVAFLEAPPQLAARAEVRFFDAVTSADKTTALRKKWHEHHSDTTSLPYFVLGYPNFGHVIEDAPRRAERLSITSLPAYVTQLEDHPWDGRQPGKHAPQLSVEVDARKDNLAIGMSSELRQKIVAKLFHSGKRERKRAFGGFSGGPIAFVDPDGEFLIGITKPGGWVFDPPAGVRLRQNLLRGRSSGRSASDGAVKAPFLDGAGKIPEIANMTLGQAVFYLREKIDAGSQLPVSVLGFAVDPRRIVWVGR